jgi:hypothetical protein
MALFGLGDIKFDKGPVKSGPLAPLTESKYEKTNFRYPLDIGNADKGHYMVLYIKKQKKTSFGGEGGAAAGMQSESGFTAAANQNNLMGGASSALAKVGGAGSKLSGSLAAAQNFASGVSAGINSAADKLGSAVSGVTDKISEVGGNVQAGLNNVFGMKKLPLGGNSAAQRSVISTNIKSISAKRGAGEGGLARTVEETKAAVTLYMPETLLFNFSQSFQQAAIGKELAGQVAAATNLTDPSDPNLNLTGARDDAARAGTEVAGRALGALGGGDASAQVGLAGLTGSVVNPMLEMVYSSPNFRSFQFDFNFYPRDEKEALEVQKILKLLMFHQAPEIASGTPGFLVPPSEFDIKFYYAGKENMNIPVIAPSAVLTTMDVNYAPQGASFYEVPGETSPTLGGTGMPFAVNLVLQFQETIFLTKGDFHDEKSEIKPQGQKARNDPSRASY